VSEAGRIWQRAYKGALSTDWFKKAVPEGQQPPAKAPKEFAAHLRANVQGITTKQINAAWKAAIAAPKNGGGGNHSELEKQLAGQVSQKLGIAQNENPNSASADRIPSNHPEEAKTRVPDLKLWGPNGSILKKGSIVEIKASTLDTFGDMSSRSRHQTEDMISAAEEMRAIATQTSPENLQKALRDKGYVIPGPDWTLEEAKQYQEALKKVKVEVYSHMNGPESGDFELETRGANPLLVWNKEPRQDAAAPPSAASPTVK
jgi:hypothetical protein